MQWSHGLAALYHQERQGLTIFSDHPYLDNTYILVTPYKNMYIVVTHLYHYITSYYILDISRDFLKIMTGFLGFGASGCWSSFFECNFHWDLIELISVSICPSFMPSHILPLLVFFFPFRVFCEILSISTVVNQCLGMFLGTRMFSSILTKHYSIFCLLLACADYQCPRQFLERLWKSACSRSHSQQAVCLQPTCFGD